MNFFPSMSLFFHAEEQVDSLYVLLTQLAVMFDVSLQPEMLFIICLIREHLFTGQTWLRNCGKHTTVLAYSKFLLSNVFLHKFSKTVNKIYDDNYMAKTMIMQN